MAINSGRAERVGNPGRGAAILLAGFLAMASAMNDASAVAPDRPAPGETPARFPTVRAEHEHVRALLVAALRYLGPANKMIDPVSGYPFEGWNQDPEKGLFLRSFTQLTAIGQGMELLANVGTGEAEMPGFTREQGLAALARMVRSLREDQKDSRLSSRGLLGNFLDLATGKRLGPLAETVEKSKILDAFGRERGEALWKALQAKGWLASRNQDREAAIQRGAAYGWKYFDGPLASFGDKATKDKVLAILDQRVVMVVFGDNANLSASVAKTIGALLLPGIKDRPGVEAIRRDLERFLEDQRDGYARLYDAKGGLFYFGWDATRDRLFGWEDLEGKWVTGHVDYLVNEFRGPATFVAVRFGLPTDAIRNLGFKMKPYRMTDGRDLYALAPWEGSAFQALGLGLSMMELECPSWRRLLENVVEIEIDYAARKKLPGFLSESYTGTGTQYTGAVGIPEITVSPRPRITDAASLYTLGAAYTVAPEKVERFLAANWPVVSKLLTDHGPWEGFNVTRQEPIRFQTSAHTLSLILGLLGTSSDHMKRYFDSKGRTERAAEIFKPGVAVDLLSDETNAFAWDDKDVPIRSTRGKGTFRVTADRIQHVGIAFVPTRAEGVNLSGGLLTLRYRSALPMESALIALKPAGTVPAVANLIPIEINTRFADTKGRDGEIQVPLPATPGLAQIKEVVISFGNESTGRPIDLTITRLVSTP